MSETLQGDRLHQAFDAYYQFSQKKGRRIATLDEIKWFSGRFLKFIGDKELGHDLVQDYIDSLLSVGFNHKAWKLSSVNGDFKIIKKISKWLVKNKYLDEAFLRDDFVIPETDDETGANLADLPSSEVAQQIILLATEPAVGEHANHRMQKAEMRDAFNFILRTGIRVGELRKMRGSDLRLDAETPSYVVRAAVSKSRTYALLPISQANDVLEMLRKRVENDPLFFVNDGSMNKALKRGCKKYGWQGRITNHSLRHIFACSCAKNGMPVMELSRLMRHASIEITNAYYIHYNVKELSVSLHKYNDLVRQEQPEIPANKLFDAARSAFESTGIALDSRFEYVPEVTADEMVLRVKLRNLGAIV